MFVLQGHADPRGAPPHHGARVRPVAGAGGDAAPSGGAAGRPEGRGVPAPPRGAADPAGEAGGGGLPAVQRLSPQDPREEQQGIQAQVQR